MIAEILSDTADIFTESVNSDGLRLLLSYCFEITALKRGKIVIDDSHQATHLEVVHDPSSDSLDLFSRSLVEKARISLRPESTISELAGKSHNEYVFPLRIRTTTIGAIHLVGSHNSTLSEHSLTVMQSVADIAATSITQTHRLQQAHMLTRQLQGALESRVLIEQAKGILAGRESVDFVDAFQHIRSQARQQQRPVTSVAADIVTEHQNLILNRNSSLVRADDF